MTNHASSNFPQTSYSVIQLVKSGDSGQRQRALETLASVYWRPVYHHLRLKWNKRHEDARDLTQQFFLFALEKRLFAAYDPAQAKFRTFLRKCLDNFVSNEEKAAARIKRGGEMHLVPLEITDDSGVVQQLEIADEYSLAEEFDRQWMRGLFAAALDGLKKECERERKQTQFAVFEAYDVLRDDRHKISYDDLAVQHGIPATQITNYLHAMRRRFRDLVLEKLREVTGSEQEFREESRLLNRTPPRVSGGAGGGP